VGPLRQARPTSWCADQYRVTVYARELAAAKASAAALLRVVQPRERVVTTTEVPCGFHFRGQYQTESVTRQIGVVPWAEIQLNYEAQSAAVLGDLMRLESPVARGRIVLPHGPAGTGKTTTIRALAHAWAPWCRLEYVLDPEALFTNTENLNLRKTAPHT
jgi:ABC-type transport system involved in cytochrome bd biosynthesis fused ATPase/permease subunit